MGSTMINVPLVLHQVSNFKGSMEFILLIPFFFFRVAVLQSSKNVR